MFFSKPYLGLCLSPHYEHLSFLTIGEATSFDWRHFPESEKMRISDYLRQQSKNKAAASIIERYKKLWSKPTTDVEAMRALIETSMQSEPALDGIGSIYIEAAIREHLCEKAQDKLRQAFNVLYRCAITPDMCRHVLLKRAIPPEE